MKRLLLNAWPSTLGLLLAACALGLVFNSLTPLGVRFKAGHRPAGANSEPGIVSASTPAALPYSNQMVSARIEPASSGVAPDAEHQHGPSGAAHAPSMPSLGSLTWPQVKPLLASNLVVLVDARAAAAFQAEHIPGAVSLPVDATAEQLARFKHDHPPTTPVVLYCGSAACPLSYRLAETLMGSYGYTNVRHMPGGFAEYRLAEQLAAAGGTDNK